MKNESKLKHVVILGAISASIQADKEAYASVDHTKILEYKNNEKELPARHLNKMVLIQGVKTWVTDDQSINDLDLEPIKYKLITEDNVTELSLEQADEIGEKYRAFLYLSKKYPHKNIVPSKDVDMFWHAHILDTYKYKEDSEKIFGKFFHHYPYFGMKDQNDKKNLEDSFNETLDIYRKEFPSKISKEMIASGALCIGEAKPIKAFSVNRDQDSALCIGEAKPIKASSVNRGQARALCIGEAKPIKNEVNSSLGEDFENRERPRFDRNSGSVIFK